MPIEAVKYNSLLSHTSAHRKHPRVVCGVYWLLNSVFVVPVVAQTNSIQFEEHILPIFQANCVKCHAGSSPQAGLDVRTLADLLKGGISGPAIIAGSAEKSLLYKRLLSGQMPLGGQPLTPQELERVRLWIERGALALNTKQVTAPAAGSDPADRAHWAFQPPRHSAVPKVKGIGRVRTPIDAFVLAELEKKNLGFSADADRVVLLRRIFFDVIGLPPTPAEVDAFVADKSSDAYEKVVDRLLASERYGECWARHWLDWAGYADSEGVLAEDRIRTNAWRYRDYVIRAYNADKLYDRFLTEQVAGDEISEYYKYDNLPPSAVEDLEATGFLRTAVDATREDFLPPDFAEYQWRTFFDTEQIVGSALLGLTIQCARCHDHKYEPIAQRDYYRLQAFFAGAIRPTGPVLPSYMRVVVQASKAEQKEAEKNNAPVDPVVKALKSLQEARLNEFRAKHPKGEDATEVEVRQMFPEYAAKADELTKELKEEDSKLIKLPSIRALYDLDASPPATKVLRRGDPSQPEEAVEPGIPTVLDDPAHPFRVAPPAPGAKTTGRRRALAEWLTRPDNPLTARIIVNRIWAAYFGEGIVATLENFGKSGAAPKNQAMLDWMATDFVQRGWSIKAMQRLILTSTVYRQASHGRNDGLQIDPENRLLWRMTPRRLEAEIIRDAVLATAGTLNLKMYGEPVPTDTKPTGEIVPEGDAAGGRRSIYQIVRRSAPQSLLEVFDAPVMETNCTRRVTSTTATQALALMNGEFITSQSQFFARRVLKEAPPAGGVAQPVDPTTVSYAFRVVFARQPKTKEVGDMLDFLRGQAGRYKGLDPETVERKIYADLCQALFSMNEFVYLD